MIQNKYIVTKKLYIQWGFENYKKFPQLGFSIFWCIMTLIAIFLWLCEGSFLFIVMMFYTIYRAFFRWIVLCNAQYNRLLKVHNGSTWSYNIFFDTDAIQIKDGINTTSIGYADIKCIKEEGNRIWLIFNNKIVLRLYKDCFVNSNCEECKAYISEMNLEL